MRLFLDALPIRGSLPPCQDELFPPKGAKLLDSRMQLAVRAPLYSDGRFRPPCGGAAVRAERPARRNGAFAQNPPLRRAPDCGTGLRRGIFRPTLPTQGRGERNLPPRPIRLRRLGRGPVHSLRRPKHPRLPKRSRLRAQLGAAGPLRGRLGAEAGPRLGARLPAERGFRRAAQGRRRAARRAQVLPRRGGAGPVAENPLGLARQEAHPPLDEALDPLRRIGRGGCGALHPGVDLEEHVQGERAAAGGALGLHLLLLRLVQKVFQRKAPPRAAVAPEHAAGDALRKGRKAPVELRAPSAQLPKERELPQHGPLHLDAGNVLFHLGEPILCSLNCGAPPRPVRRLTGPATARCAGSRCARWRSPCSWR